MKGILFKPWKIKAIADKPDIVTVTRRVIKPQPYEEDYLESGYYAPALIDKDGNLYPADYEVFGAYTSDGEITWRPRYRVGETVYIKEGYELYTILGHEAQPNKANIRYLSDNLVTWATIPIGKPLPKKGYHSPLFLPEWAARYFVKITDVRVERLQLPLSLDELEREGGEQALEMLEKINGLWVWRYEFKRGDRC